MTRDPLAPRRPYADLLDWALGDDTGVSSQTIAAAWSGANIDRPSRPWDPSDFGRCYRLLKAFPERRADLHRVSDRWPEWGPLVEAWDELSALFEQEAPSGSCPRLYARMKALEGPGYEAAGWTKTAWGWERPVPAASHPAEVTP